MVLHITNTLRRAVALTALALFSFTTFATNYYVTPDGKPLATGATAVEAWKTPWDDATKTGVTSLANALALAIEGDNIYLLGFEAPTVPVYRVPEKTPSNVGFNVKAGVHIYGGWAPDQDPIGTAPDKRAYESGCSAYFKYRSVVSADISGNDVPNEISGISADNVTRSDNAREVFIVDLTPSAATAPGGTNDRKTVIDGLVIEGGAACKGTDITGETSHGGGIFVYASKGNALPFQISNCVFFNNYAKGHGGALYVAESADNAASAIFNCVAFNNQAGIVGNALANNGAGFYIAGRATAYNSVVHNNRGGGIVLSANAKAANVTVAMNSVAGIDGMASGNAGSVCNSVIWNNDRLFFLATPDFTNCAFHEITPDLEAKGNIYVGRKTLNEQEASAFFTTAATTHGFDFSYNARSAGYAYHYSRWGITERSALIDKGQEGGGCIPDGVGTDLAGNDRVSGGRTDIGACEFVALEPNGGRIFYVSASGDNNPSEASSWANATSNLQGAIDAAAEKVAKDGGTAEVWVAAGVYVPGNIDVDPTNAERNIRMFRMYSGVHVYGGFAGSEAAKGDRRKNKENGPLPWNYKNKTVLVGVDYLSIPSDALSGTSEYSQELNTFTGSESNSTHVLWFAPFEGEAGFAKETVLEGVTVMGGRSKSDDPNVADWYREDLGAGIYAGVNARIVNCIVTECEGRTAGAGIYLDGGIVEGSLIMNCGHSEAGKGFKGGGIYLKNQGLVAKSMITNCAAADGAAVYMEKGDAGTAANLILSTSVISNNTAGENGAVYADNGGVVLHSTIVNNTSRGTTVTGVAGAPRTGGLYIDGYSLVYNSLLWNNSISGNNRVQTYINNPNKDNTRFYNTAFSSLTNIDFNNTWQQDLKSLSDENTDDSHTDAYSTILQPNFSFGGIFQSNDDFKTKVGVQTGLKYNDIDYCWTPDGGSDMRGKGMSNYNFDASVLYSPELDLTGVPFSPIPAVGAIHVDHASLNPQRDGSKYVIYVDPTMCGIGHDGSSWEKAVPSVNDALLYMDTVSTVPAGVDTLEIRLREGTYEPGGDFVGDDTRSMSINIAGCIKPLSIVGGYSRTGATLRNPVEYRSVFDANRTLGADNAYYHCVHIHKDADVVIDGVYIVNGDASAHSVNYGAGIWVEGIARSVTLRNVVLQNNTAISAAAVAANNTPVTMVNCVVNNNSCMDNGGAATVIAKGLTLKHSSFINNNARDFSSTDAPAVSASYSLNNYFLHDGTITGFTELGNDLAADDLKLIFVNPTTARGAGEPAYLGGYPSFRPLTSSAFAGENIINKGAADLSAVNHDITLGARNLGGLPDLGAYEADLPANGSVLYVTPNGGGTFDGSSWENAIAGNMIYDLNSSANINIPTSDSRYIGFFDATSRPYAETSGASKLFFEHLNEDLNTGNADYNTETKNGVTHITGAERVNIKNTREERYVGGLQYAVEKASASASSGQRVQVWVAGGVYTDYKGFVIRDKVEVLGGFPNAGAPGLDDRHPLLSQYIPANESAASLDKAKYETILQIQDVNPVSSNSTLPEKTRKPVLFQPDVCVPTKSPSGRESSFTYWYYGFRNWLGSRFGSNVPNTDETASNTYRWNLTSGEQNGTYEEYQGAVWDGFTIRNGFYKDYQANRDGGAGVRMFRGVKLRNCVVTQNYISSDCSRGAGIYCDGANSEVINCFILNNSNNGDESYGGGMYMILGTGYNNLVANNYAQTKGGGIFIEAATFYNNTIAYNSAGVTGGLHQYYNSNYSGGANLRMYNCLLYGNGGAALGFEDVTKFVGAYNCYVHSSTELGNSITSRLHNSFTGTNASANLFAKGDAAKTENNFRLNAATVCLNNGTDILGDGITLPATDVDFTDRIKDCTVDIGAYELDNDQNIAPDDANAAIPVFYVTETGSGSANGSSPDNAACEMKLQDVLYAAGKLVADGVKPIVKVAEGTYEATELADPNDPQSYSFTVPYGVTLMGGYDAGFKDHNGNDLTRNAYAHPTILSVKRTNKDGVEVRGYHVLTFDGAATSVAVNGAANSFAETQAEESAAPATTVDGIILQDGEANSTVGENNSIGGGAVVPAWAHIRNCVVRDCYASKSGGGLYLLPGATVSGTLLRNNEAENGGAVYADNTNASPDLRARMISCTVLDNNAAEGGGISFENGALTVLNSVIYNNTAMADKQISGVTDAEYEDNLWTKILGIETGVAPTGKAFHPFANVGVEQLELPSSFSPNLNLTDDDDTHYFTSKVDAELISYSPLVKSGTVAVAQETLETVLGVSPYDMRGDGRVTLWGDKKQLLDIGYDAHEGGQMRVPTGADDIVNIIFVKRTVDGVTPGAGEGTAEDYLGRSFRTPLVSLNRALNYINHLRNGLSKTEDPDGKIADAANETEFIILLTADTHKPNVRRADASTAGYDQRQNSFVVPAGVSIFGGFNGDETIDGKNVACKFGKETVGGETFTNITVEELKTLLDARKRSDLNNNGVVEPYEFTNQSVLSGQLDVSADNANAYHVLYTDGANPNTALNGLNGKKVVLDGVTVRGGLTANQAGEKEVGKGAAVYTAGVDYDIRYSSFTDNNAVLGGAVAAENASVCIYGSLFAGNGMPDGATGAMGGALYGKTDKTGTAVDSISAVNTIFANNSSQTGAVVATGGDGYKVRLTNCNLVKNEAAELVISATAPTVTNSVVWGNAITGTTWFTGGEVSHSASDKVDGEFETDKDAGINIVLNAANMAVDGPHFAAVPAEAGVAGYRYIDNKWNPASISVLVDNGDGSKPRDGVSGRQESGAYFAALQQWIEGGNRPFYMKKPDVGTDVGAGLNRYAGRSLVGGENSEDHPLLVDIGTYEYQYDPNMSGLDTVYVDIQERGDASGDSWANATSSLDAAIRALSNPTGGKSTGKHIFVREGIYSLLPASSDNNALVLSNRIVYNNAVQLDILFIHGSYDDTGKQDFSKPTVITVNPAKQAKTLMKVNTNGADVMIEGVCFDKGTAASVNGIDIVAAASAATHEGMNPNLGNITLKNVSFLELGKAVQYAGRDGRTALMANVLFAKNTVALGTDENYAAGLTVVNATFAGTSEDTHKLADTAVPSDIYNSVFWNIGAATSVAGQNGNNWNIGAANSFAGQNGNKLLGNAANNDILNGPNFVDPENNDYRIRPSMQLLNQGNDGHYTGKVMGGVDTDDAKAKELSLSGSPRFVGTIDVGAYEYESDLNGKLYVKAGATGNGSGTDWANAMTDLQTAADHAALYVLGNKDNGNDADDAAVVYVHRNVKAGALDVKTGGVKIYGSMSDEDKELADRNGLLMSDNRSELTSLSMAAAGETGTVVVDGFELVADGGVVTITGSAGGNGVEVLSTSLVDGNANLKGVVLYNTIVKGGITTEATTDAATIVNVTATGAVADGVTVHSSIANAQPVGYIGSEYWQFQLKDNAVDYIDKGNSAETEKYAEIAGHRQDVSGAPRFIGEMVDFGAFETWNIAKDTTVNITLGAVPTNNHVVYVRENSELVLGLDGDNPTFTAGEPFKPGYLLLEHKAELVGQGNSVVLDNFAVERNLAPKALELLSMPFTVNKFEINGQEYDLWKVAGYQSLVNIMYYDGRARAAYDYNMDKSAWKPLSGKQDHSILDGLLVENVTTADIKMRMSGTYYAEGEGVEKPMTFMKYNFSTPWTDPADGGDKFTHKENMSWNLVGSPYLCTMNYGDMEYGRVIYQLNGSEYKMYDAVNTALRGVDGFIPVGTSVFTQTATLSESEKVKVAPRKGAVAEVQSALDYLAVAIRRIDADASYAPATTDDAIALTAVASADAGADYNINTDAVKIAAHDSLATEIYMLRYGNRYSLLSDLDIEGTVPVGVSVGSAGSYSIYIPDYADRSGYDVVALHDTYTDKVVDLKETDYIFTADERGEINDRFYITFKHTADSDAETTPSVYTPFRGTAVVAGLDVMKRTTIRVYDAKGTLVAERTVHDISASFSLPPDAAYLFVVTTDGTTDKTVLKTVL